MRSNYRSTTRLRLLLEKQDPIIKINAYDSLSAKIIEQSGFNVVGVAGYASSASLLGQPDFEIITMPEMREIIWRISSCVSIPIMADGETGFGGPINVIRTVQEYEKAGAASINIEDQASPKRCGHMEGKQLISQGEMVNKIMAAIEARSDPDFVIIARTDARSVYGLDEAIKRAQAYIKAGADLIYIESPESIDELKRISSSINVPLYITLMEGGKTPNLAVRELSELGFKVICYPVSTLYAAAYAVKAVTSAIKETGSTTSLSQQMLNFKDFNELIGAARFRELEKRFY